MAAEAMAANVFRSTDPVLEVGADWIGRLKAAAAAAPQKRARLCLHRDDGDPLHEMIIVFHRDTLITPHRHVGKSESFHVLLGALDVLIFDDGGRPERRVRIGSADDGRNPVYRLSAPLWHSVLVRSEFAAIHEVTNGPFDPARTVEAPWAPRDATALRALLARADAALD